MKNFLLFLALMALSACATKRSSSYTGLKSSIGSAQNAASQTDRHLTEIKGGTHTIDYKATRALDYFN